MMQPEALAAIDSLIEEKIKNREVTRSKTDYNFQLASKVSF